MTAGTTSETAVLDALAAAAKGAARAAGPDDVVDGVPARFVARPDGTVSTAAVMRAAAEHGLAVIPRGHGTKLGWGAPPARVDLLLETGGMSDLIDHAAGDLVLQVQAGMALAELQAALAPAGQRLGIDPVVPGEDAGSIGGIVATAASGPLRLSHGAVRDLLIGITFVRADGGVAKAGGTVVKNVAGYDLAKALAGSWGTLAVVTEAVFRLHPLPAARRVVSVPVSDPDEAHRLVQALAHSQLVPAGAEIDHPAQGPRTLAVAAEGIAPGVEGRTAALLELLGPSATAAEEQPAWWGRAPWEAGGVALRLTSEIAGLAHLLRALDELSAQHQLPVSYRGSVLVGTGHAGIAPGADPDQVARLVVDLRYRATAWGGDVVVLDAPAAVKQALDVWGPVRGLELMNAVKDRFDPEHRLAPGRFAGGI
ncbi:MAG: FAD-binding oxidoreductase [Motilibacteraceae bacterium]